MKNKYRLTALLLALFILSLAGCSQAQQDINSGKSSESEQTLPENNSLVWVIDDAGLAERLQEPLNKLLKEKGAAYTVSIIGGEAEKYEDRVNHYLEMLQDRKSSGQVTDLIYFPWTQTEHNDYASAVREGLFLPLKPEEGPGSISEILGEFALKSAKVNGTIYGLRGLPEYFNLGLAFNEHFLDKYAISKASLSGNLFENEALFQTLAKTDEEVRTPMAYWAMTEEQLGYQFLFPSCAVGYSYANGEEIVNVFAQEDTKEYLESLKNLRDKNLITFLNIDGFDFMDAENSYFAISHYGTRPSQYQFKMNEFLDKEGNQIITDAVFVPDKLDQQSLSLNPRGQITGIASWSTKPEQAYDFLKLLFTDSDIANLVKFGEEGKDYQLEDGRIAKLLNPELSPRAYTSYINDVITYPMEREPENKAENWKQYFENNAIHPLTGFQFDPEKVLAEIEATNAILKEDIAVKDSYTSEFKKLMSADADDIEHSLQALNEKLEAAGISKIVKEANRQIQEWKAHVKE